MSSKSRLPRLYYFCTVTKQFRLELIKFKFICVYFRSKPSLANLSFVPENESGFETEKSLSRGEANLRELCFFFA